MADEEVARRIDEALNKILTTTDQSGNMRKEMKKNMYENVSILRNLFVKMQATVEEVRRQKDQTENEAQAMEAKLDSFTANNKETQREI